MSGNGSHRVVIVGGGTAGISVAARLRKGGVDDIVLIDPAEKHYYQPLWTLVGGGRAPAKESEREEPHAQGSDLTSGDSVGFRESPEVHDGSHFDQNT